jgi:hypothetical protein
MSKKIFALIILIIIAIVAAIGYFFFFMTPAAGTSTAGNTDSSSPFTTFDRGGVSTSTKPAQGTTGSSVTTGTGAATAPKLPILRQLYATPVGGIGASSTASTSLVRFIDRGTGHVYEAPADSAVVSKISNTMLSRVYESYWNAAANAFVLRYLKADSDAVTTFYAELQSVASVSTSTKSSTSTPTAPATIATTQYELHGKYLSTNITNIAVSPKHDKIFEFTTESGQGTGYISTFNESSKLEVFDTPLTQVNTEWPEDNTLAITTKGSATTPGFLYFFNIKKALMSEVIGGIHGLSTLVSHDASKVLYAETDGDTIHDTILTVKDGTRQDFVFHTLPEKCVWSMLHKEDLYCAVPFSIPTNDAEYPDAWYQGKVSFADNIWQINTNTGEVHQIADIIIGSKKSIDAVNLTLDPKENFLYFTNKRDLSLWSLDLTQ